MAPRGGGRGLGAARRGARRPLAPAGAPPDGARARGARQRAAPGGPPPAARAQAAAVAGSPVPPLPRAASLQGQRPLTRCARGGVLPPTHRRKAPTDGGLKAPTDGGLTRAGRIAALSARLVASARAAAGRWVRGAVLAVARRRAWAGAVWGSGGVAALGGGAACGVLGARLRAWVEVQRTRRKRALPWDPLCVAGSRAGVAGATGARRRVGGLARPAPPLRSPWAQRDGALARAARGYWSWRGTRGPGGMVV
jgi:hypothetical protein